MFSRLFKARRIFHILKIKLLILSLSWQFHWQGIVSYNSTFFFFFGPQNVEFIWSQLLQENAWTKVNILYNPLLWLFKHFLPFHRMLFLKVVTLPNSCHLPIFAQKLLFTSSYPLPKFLIEIVILI